MNKFWGQDTFEEGTERVDLKLIADENWAGHEPAIDGSDTELAVEAFAARISAVNMLRDPAEYTIKMIEPTKGVMWMTYADQRRQGWYGHATIDEAIRAVKYLSVKLESDKVTLFDDGTWRYGIWE